MVSADGSRELPMPEPPPGRFFGSPELMLPFLKEFDCKSKELLEKSAEHHSCS